MTVWHTGNGFARGVSPGDTLGGRGVQGWVAALPDEQEAECVGCCFRGTNDNCLSIPCFGIIWKEKEHG